MKKIYDDYNEKGLEIYGFPCNQFGAQEPKGGDEIREFVKQYDVNFPLLEKGDVNGHDCHPVYKYMRENSSLAGGDITWNFAKFLVNSDGHVVKYYLPDESPDSIVPEIEKLLKHHYM